MEDRAVTFLACCIICIFITWLAVPLRCYARLKVVAKFAAEDWLMLAAQILFTLEIIGCGLQIKYGMGSHIDQVSVSNLQKAFFLLFLGTHLYATVMMLARLSIGLLLLRLMASKRQRIVVMVVLFLNVAFWLLYIVWIWNLCTPVERYWIWNIDHGYCRYARIPIGSYLQSGAAIFSDASLAIIPMYVLYKSKLARKTRYATAAILSLGFLASVSTMIRLVEVKKANEAGMMDYIYTIGDVLIWSIIEQALAITAGCFATYRPLFVKVARVTEVSDGTRGRTGRPPQPGDTQVDWDPGLTIDMAIPDDEEAGKSDSLVQVRSAASAMTGEVRGLGLELGRADSQTPLHTGHTTRAMNGEDEKG